MYYTSTCTCKTETDSGNETPGNNIILLVYLPSFTTTALSNGKTYITIFYK